MRSDREQQLRAQGWREGGFGVGEENQHPGAKITMEITWLRRLGVGREKNWREVRKRKVGGDVGRKMLEDGGVRTLLVMLGRFRLMEAGGGGNMRLWGMGSQTGGFLAENAPL